MPCEGLISKTMTLPNKEEISLPDKEAEEEKKLSQEEEQLSEKVKRTREDIKNIFVKTYNFDPEDERLPGLIDREMAHGKVVSKLIGQKVHWRDKATGEKKPEEKKDGEITPSKEIEAFRTLERKKATEKVLSKIAEKHNDLGDIKAVYDKIKEEYHEKGDETLRGDFEKRIWGAFYKAYPDKYEDKIRADERKRLLEDNIDVGSITSKANGEKHETKKKIFVKKTPITDWYKPKK
jgi:hypothetical protein